MLKGLLLDFDGTIAETEKFGHRVAYNSAFTELGLGWDWDETLYGKLLAVAGGRERLRHYLAQYRPAELEAALDSDLIGRIYQIKVKHFAAAAPRLPLRPGIVRLLTEAHAAGIKLAVATTGAEAGVEALLASTPGLRGLFSVVAGHESAERKKPAPDIYLWAIKALGLEPAQCVAIEDSHVGLGAATAAGLPTIVTVSAYTANEDFSRATSVLSDLGEPAAPSRCLGGLAPPSGFVDLAFLQAIRAD